ncbi:MAG: inositol monophosphatase family protein [Rhodospirillales bacterium]
MRDFGEVENLQVSKKGPADFVSQADKDCERTLLYELQKARPKYGFLMEEQGALDGADSSNRWVIDPLDGTTNFLHGLAHFAISIGLERDGQPYAGVIYEPVGNQLFWGEEGKGAFLNGQRLRVSARRELSESLFATGVPFLGIDGHDRFQEQLGRVMAVSAGLRRFGAAALDLAYVAAGRYEGYWENGLNPWDICAGIAIVREAGGFVTDLSGGKDFLNGKGIIAANPIIHSRLAKVLAGRAT